MKLIFILFSLIIAGTSFPQGNTGKIMGSAFVDFYYKINGDSTGGDLQYSKLGKNSNGFEARRIKLGYEYNFSEKISTVIAIETEGRKSSTGYYDLYLKDAYIRIKKILPGTDLIAGLQPTPEIGYDGVYSFWSYRSVEKSLLHMRGIISSRDWGVALHGKFVKDKLSCKLMLANGSGLKIDGDKYKKVYATVLFKPVNSLSLQFHSDYSSSDIFENIYTFSGFVGFKIPGFTIGSEVFWNFREARSQPGNTVSPFGFSVFSEFGLMSNGSINLFARLDNFNPNSKSHDNSYTENFLIFGSDIQPVKNLHVIPNLWMNFYSHKKNFIEQKTDVVSRITLVYSF